VPVPAAATAVPGTQQQWMPLSGPAQFAAAESYERRMRVRQNLQPLGIIWIMFGVYRVVTGLVGALVLHSIAHGGMFGDAPPFLPHLFATLAPVVATISVVMGACAIVTGYGILARKQWGRIVAIVFGVLALLKLPFGTALGIYTLWVLAPGPSGPEWEAIAREV
jgi:hypothetical protein